MIGLDPDSFDFSQTELRGRGSTYSFEKMLTSGAQGIVAQYKDLKTGSHVVVKFPKTSDSRHDQQIREHVDEEGTVHYYKAFLNESDIVTHLTFCARIAAYYRVLRKQGFKVSGMHTDEFHFIVGGKKKTALNFLKEASIYDDIEAILASPETVFPLYLDSVVNLLDGKTGKRIHPIPETGNQISQAAYYMFDGTGIPIYHAFSDGVRLDRFIEKEPEYDKRLQVAKELVRSVSVLHWHGVMHRDIKPTNVLVLPTGKVIVIDYGDAMFFQPSDRMSHLGGLEDIRLMHHDSEFNTLGGIWSGTRMYASPESYHNDPCMTDDLYQLGVLASEIITGEHPYLSKARESTENSSETDEGAKEAVKKWMLSITENPCSRAEYNQAYDNYCVRHRDNVPREILMLFHPDPDMRPKLHTIVSRMGLSLPSGPPLGDLKEQDNIPFNYLPRIAEVPIHLFDYFEFDHKLIR